MTKFRYVLHRKGYTGKSFAAVCGVGPSIIYKYMCGTRPLSLKVASRFAAILKVKPESLMGEMEE